MILITVLYCLIGYTLYHSSHVNESKLRLRKSLSSHKREAGQQRVLKMLGECNHSKFMATLYFANYSTPLHLAQSEWLNLCRWLVIIESDWEQSLESNLCVDSLFDLQDESFHARPPLRRFNAWAEGELGRCQEKLFVSSHAAVIRLIRLRIFPFRISHANVLWCCVNGRGSEGRHGDDEILVSD